MTDLTQGKNAILLLTCPDQRGLVSVISTFLFEHGANILHANQHRDSETGLFHMRIEWNAEDGPLTSRTFSDFFSPTAHQYSMTWNNVFSDEKAKVAIFVSQFDHCLADLLYRNRIGEIDCEISLIVSNHPIARQISQFYEIPFFEIPIQPDEKAKTEEIQLELLSKHKIDLVILARYMQILSPQFIHAYPNQIINIHHSFLPAFQGARPYHQAYARGVKLIGASSHYATEQLDEGPIIHQDVTPISHRDQVKDLVQKGRNLETHVLSQAVKWHLERRILVCGNRTVVFS